jgi:hypothetical protein
MCNDTFQFLLEDYRTVWKNRILQTGDKAAEDILKDAIRRELLDENSHPRVRKPVNDKYVSSSRRILDSQLSPESKIDLLRLHMELVEQLN